MEFVKFVLTSSVDPHCCQCGSGYGSGSKKTNPCGSRRIRIPNQTFESQRDKFYLKNILKIP